MKVIRLKERINQLLSIVLVYSISINYIIPFARGIDAMAESINLKVNTSGLSYFCYNDVHSSYNNKAEKLDKIAIPSSSDAIKETSKKLITVSTSGGPGQTETTGSTANLSSGIVDEFTGDLSYSIPLLDVEGFPIAISYNPNVTMDQEASWVGLGWNLSLGSINRDMRGIPDDFEGDKVTRTTSYKSEEIDGKSTGYGFQAGFGIGIGNNSFIDAHAGLSLASGNYLNNYTGKGQTFEFDLSVGSSFMGVGADASVGLSTDTQNGVGYTKGFSFQAMPAAFGLSFGGYQEHHSETVHSRSGVKTISSSSGWNVGVNLLGSGYMHGKTTGSMRTFGKHSYVPRFQNASIGFSNSSVVSGGGVFGFTPWYAGLTISKSNYSSTNSLLKTVTSYPAYGFNHISSGHKRPDAMLDFNRGASSAISNETKTLAFTAPTYDMYYCNAPGLSSNFRSYRYDVYHVHDPIVFNLTKIDGTAKSNVGTAVVPTNFGWQGSNTTTTGASVSSTSLSLESTAPLNGIDKSLTRDNEEYYFRTIGEATPNPSALLNQYGGQTPSFIPLVPPSQSNVDIVATSTLVSPLTNNATALPSVNYDLSRPENAVHYKELTVEELKTKNLRDYQLFDCAMGELFTFTLPSTDLGLSTSTKKLDHHTGAIEVINQGGMRYVFGIPEYNYSTAEVMFSVEPNTGTDETEYNESGLYSYATGDNTVNNSKGRQNLYDKTVTPAYSSSYLLSEMYSSDYIDRTGDGPTADDIGNYYKINYTNLYGEDDPFAWRMPMCPSTTDPSVGLPAQSAYLNKNYNADPWDDMANYLYGEKDLYYVASVETKNYVAFFCLEDRQDQFSALSEDGGFDYTKPGKLLKKILLFSKNDILISNNQPTPIKIIEFEYDYSRCDGYVGNVNTFYPGLLDPQYANSKGKLTLTAIYSYSGKSNEGKTTPIEFEYSSVNPDFAFNSSDRWGNYKPNVTTEPNHEFPYADQSSSATQNIWAWKLWKVRQPGGAELTFAYETDRYSFVQDKRAMRMFEVIGMSSTDGLNYLDQQSPLESWQITNTLEENYRNPGSGMEKDHYNVVYFLLDETLTGSKSDATAKVIQDYFTDENQEILNEVYFNMNSKLGNQVDSRNEYVQSSAKLDKGITGYSYIGVVGSNPPFNIGYMVLKPEDINKFSDDPVIKALNILFDFIDSVPFLPFSLGPIFSYKVNPLQVASWQYSRLNVPCTVYGTIDYGASAPTDYCDYDLSNDWNILGFNLYKRFNKKKYSLSFNADKSRVRLFEPDNIKYGGGCRISTVSMKDDWNAISGEYDSEYQWKYTYDDGEEYGVASYEPAVGNNENPFYELDGTTYEREKLPKETSYQIKPWAELVFPSAQVGYSHVESYLTNTNYSLGKNVSTYYTNKDYPTKNIKTTLSKLDYTGKNAVKVNDAYAELLGLSQGFYVETSDFHGKPYMNQTIDGNGNVISSSVYNYYDHNSNSMSYVNQDGSITSSMTPRDVDIYADSWQFASSYFTASVTKSTAAGASVLPPWPYFKKRTDIDVNVNTVNAQALTFCKVVHHSAEIESITTSYLGSENTAKNIIHDARSGNVILSSLKNEFEDDLYSLNYPAHWKYTGLANSSVNDHAYFKGGSISGTNNIINSSATNGASFSIGDELLLHNELTTIDTKAWVLDIVGSDVYLIDENGSAGSFNGYNWSDYSIRIQRSGRKNQVGASMMSLASRSNPVAGAAIDFPAAGASVLNVSAARLGENSNVPCIPDEYIGDPIASNYSDRQYEPGDVINPFLKGVRGNYRMTSQYSLQTDRVTGNTLGIRQDGDLTDFIPFYAPVNGQWYSIDEALHPNYSGGDLIDWRELGKTTVYDEFGKPLESVNQLDIASSVQYGMNADLKLIPKSSAVNAKANEIAFDGFEDYQYYTANQIDYLNYGFSMDPTGSGTAILVDDIRHSGDYSMEISNPTTFTYYASGANPGQTGHIVNGEYQVQGCDCIKSFEPTVAETYVLSVWVKEDTKIYPYQKAKVSVSFLDLNNQQIGYATILSPEGAVIDGWQKIEGQYYVPLSAKKIVIKFYTDDNSTLWVDDFRTHPDKASMKTVVYDQKTLLPSATHDSYNYTTYYNYDEEFGLVRSRVETTNGIQTVSEIETGMKRNN